MEDLNNVIEEAEPAVIAVFEDDKQLKKTLDDLKNKNFNNEDISVLMSQKKDPHDFYKQKLIKGVETGAAIGIAEGGVLGLLAGLSLITIPGAGVFMAAGPFVSAITGATIGANTGAVAGVLVGYGLAKAEAKKIEKLVKENGMIVSVHVDDPAKQIIAKEVFSKNGATEIFSPLDKNQAKAPKKKFFSHTQEV